MFFQCPSSIEHQICSNRTWIPETVCRDKPVRSPISSKVKLFCGLFSKSLMASWSLLQPWGVRMTPRFRLFGSFLIQATINRNAINCVTTKHYNKGDEAIFSKPTDFNKSSQSVLTPKSLGLVRRKSATVVKVSCQIPDVAYKAARCLGCAFCN